MKKMVIVMMFFLTPSLASTRGLEQLERQAALQPSDGGLQLRLSEAALNAGNNALAMKACNRALELNPEEAACYIQYARVCREQQRPDQALAKLNTVRADFQANARFMTSLAGIESAMGLFKEAIADYETALRLASYRDRPFCLSGLGKCMRELRRYDESERYFLLALQQREDPWAYYELGKLYLEWKKPYAAVQALTRAKARLTSPAIQGREAVYRKLAMALFEHARTLKEKGQKAEAKVSLQKIINDRDLCQTEWNEKARFWLRRL